MDWKSIISKLSSGTEKKKRDQWMALFALGLFLLLLSSSVPGKQELPVSAAVQREDDEDYEKTDNKSEKWREERPSDLSDYEKQMEERVKALLRSVEGVGKADVMLVLKSSGEKIIHEDLSLIHI